MTSPLIQIAIDTTSVEKAIPLIEHAIAADADWIELGKPLIEFEGITGVSRLRSLLEGRYVVADLMIMAAPEKYILAARDLGINNVTVTALAPAETVVETIRAGKRHGIEVTVDLFNVRDVLETARTYAGLGADYLMVHFGVDQKRQQPDGSPIETLRQVVASVDTFVSYATYDIDECRDAVAAGASVIVQGEPLLSAENPRAAITDFITTTRTFKKAPSK